MHAARRRPCRPAAWLVMAAFLAAALAPVISQGVARYRGLSWADICTAPSTPDRDAPLAHAFEHCGYCTLHLPSLELPAPAAMPGPPGPQGAATAVRWLALAPAAPWPRAQPRAPPRA